LECPTNQKKTSRQESTLSCIKRRWWLLINVFSHCTFEMLVA
jgi:hypothetical protein